MLRVRDRIVAEPRLERVHLLLHGEERAERAAGFLEDRPPRMRQAILRQIPDGERRRLQDRAGVGLVEPGHHAEERRLAGPVGTAKTDALPIRDLPGDVIEQDTVAERLRQLL